jgi:uncharacterized radical SAM superfamily protein
MLVTRTIECFYPGSSFTAISITGGACSLNCKHCGRKYLEGMAPATTPEDLVEIANALVRRGANGFLLSGGADRSGRIGVADYAESIREIKANTDLRINAHIGLRPTDEIGTLVDSGVDAFSVDVYGSDETIREVLGLDARAADYVKVVEDLLSAGAKVVAPHICVGIHGGELRGELRAIELLKTLTVKSLILISLIPTKGTPFEAVPPPSNEMIGSVVRKAREELPDARILLGCMRSKMCRANERDLVAAGLDGIVLPSKATVDALSRDGYRIRSRSVCCALI